MTSLPCLVCLPTMTLSTFSIPHHRMERSLHIHTYPRITIWTSTWSDTDERLQWDRRHLWHLSTFSDSIFLAFYWGFPMILCVVAHSHSSPVETCFKQLHLKKTPPWVFFLPLLVKFPKHGLLCDWSQWVVFVSFKQLHFSPPRSSILKESINNIVQRLSPPPSTSVCLPSWRHRLSVVFKFWLLF